MRTSFQQQLPAGTSSFERLISQNQVCVDKTAQIGDLLENGQKYFLTRPRGFGKTLLLSAFESLFRHGLRDFRGLEIEKLWHEEPAPAVVSLDFSKLRGFQDAREFKALLGRLLASRLAREKFIPEMPAPGAGERVFAGWLASQPVSSTVILIDECDAPFAECLDRPELFREVSAILSRFYALLKSEDRAVRFLFIAGVTRLSDAALFPSLNTLRDISLSPQFGGLLGFTEEELLEHFAQALRSAAEIRGTAVSALTDDLRRRFGGFCFDSAASAHVYAPGPVLRFLSRPEDGFPESVLGDGENPDALLRRFRALAPRALACPEDERCADLERLRSAPDPEDPDGLALLAQAGFLTVRRVEEDTAFLGFPNVSAKESLAQLCREPARH